MQFESLGDRIKFYENLRQTHFIPGLPIVVRLDGVAFHTYTKYAKRPYDQRLSNAMRQTMAYLVRKTNAVVGYTQSDEITLILHVESYKSQLYFDGKIQKILSVLASECSVRFNHHISMQVDGEEFGTAVFDCRAFNVPSKWEACNALIWREQDATRNSISMAAQSVYSHGELQNKSCNEMQEMLFQKGINWNDYPEFFKRGTFLIKRIPLIDGAEYGEERAPRYYQDTEIPILTKVENLPEFIFDNKNPILKKD